MSAIVKACSVNTNIKNTGKECDTAMVATAMLIAIHSSVTFTLTDMLDPVTWLTLLIQQRKAFPLFGQQAPINTINNNAESDILVTLDDGTQVFLRYGIYNRLFETISGGFCYAESLQSLNKSGYRLLEIDQQGQMLARKNSDGTFSGFITTFMYAPSPTWADFKTNPYKNRFQISFSPVEIVNNGIIFENAESLLSMMGLIDIKYTLAAAATTTKLKFNVLTECAEGDLVALFPSVIVDLDLYIVTNKATGAVVTPSAAAIVSGHLELTGVFVSGQTYHVIGSTPAVWQTNLLPGYDGSSTGSNGIDIVIP